MDDSNTAKLKREINMLRNTLLAAGERIAYLEAKLEAAARREAGQNKAYESLLNDYKFLADHSDKLERHNELLREVTRQAREFENWILTSAERDRLQDMHDAIQAAIDGGALPVETTSLQ